MAFKFRAAAALDLRKRREELAQRARGEAIAALDRAQAAYEVARSTMNETHARGATECDPAHLVWYRNWIARQRIEVARRGSMVADRRAALDAAVARLNAAHRDVRALERLRDRNYAAFQLAERRREQKELDWLGSVRHAIKPDPEKENTWP